MADRSSSGPSDYLAAERTFLAWIRTGLALMGFGFVVARLRLVSRSVWNQPFKSRVRPYGPSFWFGTALIILGVLVNGFSARNYFRVVQDLSRGVQRIE